MDDCEISKCVSVIPSMKTCLKECMRFSSISSSMQSRLFFLLWGIVRWYAIHIVHFICVDQLSLSRETEYKKPHFKTKSTLCKKKNIGRASCRERV
eukprot:501868_1